MPPGHKKPPAHAGRAAILVVVIIGIIIVTIFVGLNLFHAHALRQEQEGQVEPAEAPRSTTDLQHSPVKRD